VIALGGAAFWAFASVAWLLRDVDPGEPVTGWSLVQRVVFSLGLAASLLVAGLGIETGRLRPLFLFVLASALAVGFAPFAVLPVTWALGTFALYFPLIGLPALAGGWLLLRAPRASD
jgi:hypothetical protein